MSGWSGVLSVNITSAPVQKPNLAPYQPPGWSDKIVVSKTAGSNTDSSPILTTDTLYVDSLIGRDTINTMPLETLAAFRDHGHVAPTLKAGVDQAEAQVQRLASLGIDLDQVGDELQREGIDLFWASYDKLFAALDEKRKQILAGEDTS